VTDDTEAGTQACGDSAAPEKQALYSPRPMVYMLHAALASEAGDTP
jgi:hypothetical protein